MRCISILCISLTFILTGCSDESLLRDVKKQKEEQNKQWQECVINYLRNTDYYDLNISEESQELLKYDAWTACGWGDSNK